MMVGERAQDEQKRISLYSVDVGSHAPSDRDPC